MVNAIDAWHPLDVRIFRQINISIAVDPVIAFDLFNDRRQRPQSATELSCFRTHAPRANRVVVRSLIFTEAAGSRVPNLITKYKPILAVYQSIDLTVELEQC